MSAKKTAKTVKKRSALNITLSIVAVLLMLFLLSVNLITDTLWFQQLGYFSVFKTQYLSLMVTFLIGFICAALPLYVVTEIAFRTRPTYARISSSVASYRERVDAMQKLLRILVPAVFGVIAGVTLAPSWKELLLFINSSPTGQTDPLHGLDLQFYMFMLPVFETLIGFGQTIVFQALAITVAIAYLYGAISFTQNKMLIAKATRIQLAVLAAVFVLLFAAQFWIRQFTALTGTTGLYTGATYADVHATIPGLQILAIVSVLVAVLFVITAANGKWRISVIGTSALLVTSVLLTAAYPWGVQQFKVKPDEKTLEAEYLQHNITATRAAYGLQNIEVERYNAVTTAQAGALRNDAVATANIRIMDPAIIAPTISQLEQSKQYYRFHDTLSVDRYLIDGKIEDTVTVPRELNISQQTGWYNRTLVYTHGYGLVAAYGNQRSPAGEPVFLENGIPTSGKLGEFEPRIYFGRYSPTYSIVGGKREKPIEVDYPADVDNPQNRQTASGTDNAQADGAAQTGDKSSESALEQGSGERQNLTTFQGDAGPVLHGTFEKLLYALKFQDMELLLSQAVVDGSQILYKRNPLERVAAAAPYLTLDNHPYASVVDGRIVWIVDGYTTSDKYPYATVNDMSQMLVDADNPQAGAPKRINYIRNSVKATVDAYDGRVKLYAWDTSDPLLQAWQRIYPGTLSPVSEMSADLLSHVRYPNDLFKVQREVLGRYHVTDAGAFYSNEDAWKTPADPVSTAAVTARATAENADEGGRAGNAQQAQRQLPDQPPYYLTLSAGANSEPTFSIYSTFIPAQQGRNARDILTGYLAANANAGTGRDGEVNENYGKLKLLVLPKGSAINGPGQVQNSFSTDAKVASVLNILGRGETSVINGNLLTLPVGGGLLYVQPVYVRAKADRGYPLLQKVLVSFGDKIAFEDTLDQALDTLFGGNSGANAGDGGAELADSMQNDGGAQSPAPGQPLDSVKPSDPAQPSKPGGAAQPDSVTEALRQMQQAIADRDKALRAADWAAYGEADKRLQAALERALRLSSD